MSARQSSRKFPISHERDWAMWARVYWLEGNAQNYSRDKSIAWVELRLAQRHFNNNPTEPLRAEYLVKRRDEWARMRTQP